MGTLGRRLEDRRGGRAQRDEDERKMNPRVRAGPCLHHAAFCGIACLFTFGLVASQASSNRLLYSAETRLSRAAMVETRGKNED